MIYIDICNHYDETQNWTGVHIIGRIYTLALLRQIAQTLLFGQIAVGAEVSYDQTRIEPALSLTHVCANTRQPAAT